MKVKAKNRYYFGKRHNRTPFTQLPQCKVPRVLQELHRLLVILPVYSFRLTMAINTTYYDQDNFYKLSDEAVRQAQELRERTTAYRDSRNSCKEMRALETQILLFLSSVNEWLVVAPPAPRRIKTKIYGLPVNGDKRDEISVLSCTRETTTEE